MFTTVGTRLVMPDVVGGSLTLRSIYVTSVKKPIVN